MRPNAALVAEKTAGLGILNLPDDRRFFGAEGEDTAGRPGVERVRADAGAKRRPSHAALSARLAAGQGELMLIPLGDEQEFGPGLGAVGIDRPRLDTGRPGRLFVAPVRGAAARRPRQQHVADQAETCVSSTRGCARCAGCMRPSDPTNTGVVDEPTLLAVPDAVHPGWQAVADPRPGVDRAAPPVPDDRARVATAISATAR